MLLQFFRQLGQLRKDCQALRLGDIEFTYATDHRLAFTRRYKGKLVRIYVNRNMDAWDIPSGKLLMGHNMRSVAPGWLSLAPQGFCIVEE